jgi:hypothetical protein
MALLTILREIPSKVASVLEKYMRELSESEREEMKKEMMALTEEMFGERVTKEKKSKPQVVAPVPAVITREYLETLTVTELKQLGKDSVKGRKPRAEIIEILLQSTSGSSPVASAPTVALSPPDESCDESRGSVSEDELHAEPVPVIVRAEEPVKKKRAKAAPKEVKEKKEKKPKAAETEETELTVRSWYHPSEMSKPQEQRKKYYIDPETNLLYNPDQPTDKPVGKWDEETSEIIPVS